MVKETLHCAVKNPVQLSSIQQNALAQQMDDHSSEQATMSEGESETGAWNSIPHMDFPFLIDPKTHAFVNKKNSKIMFIMRGLPGSGKSTIVDTISSTFQNVVICSADHFFYQKDGTYAFKANKLNTAHAECQEKVKNACENEVSLVVIDNTNLKRWEMKPYLGTAKIYGYVVIVVEPKTPWRLDAKELTRRNKHGVTYDVIERKVNSFEDIIPFYYGWFLNETNSNNLQELAARYFKRCLQCCSQYKTHLMQLLSKKTSRPFQGKKKKEKRKIYLLS